MNWKDRYAKLTSITQLSVGDFISWKRVNKRYAIITKINGDRVWGNYNDDKMKSLQGISDCGGGLSYVCFTTENTFNIHRELQ